jgi:hypothetical protein
MEAGVRARLLRLGAEVVVGAAVAAEVGRIPVGAAVAVAVVVGVGDPVGIPVGAGAEVPASGRRGVGDADAGLTERARTENCPQRPPIHTPVMLPVTGVLPRCFPAETREATSR